MLRHRLASGVPTRVCHSGRVTSRRATHVLSLLLIGSAGGVLSGTFGIGGGIVMMPMIGRFLGYHHRRAVATSLAAIFPASVAGAIAYGSSGNVAWVEGIVLAAGGVLGSFAGTAVLHRISPRLARGLFVVALVAIAIVTIFTHPQRGTELSLTLLTGTATLGVGVAMGFASGLLGIGGGVVAVPLMILILGASDVVAKGTSLLAIIPTALVGTVTNARKGAVKVTEGLTIGVAAFAASFPGALIAHRLSPAAATWAFVGLIALILTITLLRPHRRPEDGADIATAA